MSAAPTPSSSLPDPTPILDDLNLDLLLTVLSHTLFSPFFITFIPILNFARGSTWDDSAVRWPVYWLVGICVYHFLAHLDRIHRTGGTLLLRPARLDWGEQLVLITGGCSGVGLLLANTLAVRNVSVVVLDVREKMETENYNISYYKCDVSSPSEVEAVAAHIRAELGDPTILISCAAVAPSAPILSQTPSLLSQTLATNLLGPANILRSFLPALVDKKEGHVVMLGSVLGTQGVSYLSGYCASKAGLHSLHRSLRRELRTVYNAPGVRTTLLIPGFIHTPLFASLQLPANRLRDFLAPPLAPHVVVKEIIRSVDEREGGERWMPGYARLVGCGVLEALPEGVRDWLQRWAGADEGMRGGWEGSQGEKRVGK